MGTARETYPGGAVGLAATQPRIGLLLECPQWSLLHVTLENQQGGLLPQGSHASAPPPVQPEDQESRAGASA